ncbi:MAG: YmdB family metallophosphoesterase, partial [Sphingomonadales bacterium]|nr:YmdB family metallophosphoesterase [Sphingomonadales bacterium]
MNFLFLGDIMGKSGRKAVIEHLPRLRDELSLDFVVANAENAAGGFGMTVDIAQDMFDAGVDVLTGGNHTFDKREVYGFIDSDTRVLRPINYPEGTPGQGKGTYELEDGRRVVIINALGRVFMNPLDDPFLAVENAIKHEQLGHDAQFIFVDIHAEATSEKMAMGQFLDGRVSLVVG